MELDRQHFISAMRCIANSVAVVTTDGCAGRQGATVSAFCSVSADPPTILICLNSKSRINQAVKSNKKFNLNVLPQNANYIEQRFAGAHDAEVSDRFDGMDIKMGEVPSITGATVLFCHVDEVITSGTHEIITARVRLVDTSSKQPLAYLDGAYHQVKPLALETV